MAFSRCGHDSCRVYGQIIAMVAVVAVDCKAIGKKLAEDRNGVFLGVPHADLHRV